MTIHNPTGPVPPIDSPDNVVGTDVIGNKDDTAAGSSLVSLAKQTTNGLTLPAQDSAANATPADVIGNKTDTSAGSSLVSLAKNGDLVAARDTSLSYDANSALYSVYRNSGFSVTKELHIQIGPGSVYGAYAIFTGHIQILNQFAIITEITTLNNATDMYATVHDGTAEEKITAGNPGGFVLSGATVGTMFLKDQLATQAATVLDADQVRISEPPNRLAGSPFTLNAKEGVDNFIRIYLTTTDAPVDFKAQAYFEYRPLGWGTLAFL